jgi:ADP-ribosyl-[dinitrogen reductase] hydrolase
MTTSDIMDRFRGCLLGLAVGDAVGTSAEFRDRGAFEPLTDMQGGGVFHLRPGQWTDDTSMALCLAASLVQRSGSDPRDQMEQYCRWHDTGYMSSTGKMFDIGRTVKQAIRKYRETGDPFAGEDHPSAAGNGCIMRLAPVPMFYSADIDAAERFAAESCLTTHGAAECLDGSRLLARILVRTLSGLEREEALFADAESFTGSPKIQAIARGDYRKKSEAEIVGSGYVVDSLEAALWSFLGAASFKDAVLRAANLGDDADTTAAVCGQVAGAYWGESGIPADWLKKLAMAEEIRDLADRLYHSGTHHSTPK